MQENQGDAGLIGFPDVFLLATVSCLWLLHGFLCIFTNFSISPPLSVLYTGVPVRVYQSKYQYHQYQRDYLYGIKTSVIILVLLFAFSLVYIQHIIGISSEIMPVHTQKQKYQIWRAYIFEFQNRISYLCNVCTLLIAKHLCPVFYHN